MKTTLKLSFRRPLFALLPLLMGLSSASAAPRAGVAVAYTGQLVPGQPSTYISDFFQICTNDAGECAFIARSKLGSSSFSDYLLSNGGLGRTAAPVLIRQNNLVGKNLLCLQNSGVVHSVSNQTFYRGQSTYDLGGSNYALAEGSAAFVTASVYQGGVQFSGLSYDLLNQFTYIRVEGANVDRTFCAAATGSGSAFVRGQELFTNSRRTRVARLSLNGVAVSPNGHSVISAGEPIFPTALVTKPGLYRMPNGEPFLKIAQAGDSFAGVTLASSGAVFPQFAVEFSNAAVFLAQTSTPAAGTALIRVGNTPPNTALLKTGDPAPGITGATIIKVHSFALDESGKCVIHASTGGPGLTPGEALFRSTSGSAPVLFAQTGDTITVGGQEKTITGFGLQSVLNKGVSVGPRVITANGRVAAYVKFGNDRAAFVFDAQ